MAEGGRSFFTGRAPRARPSIPCCDDIVAPSLNEKDFKFRFKRLPNTDAIQNGYCSCCFVGFRRLLPNGVTEPGLQPMVCYGCLKMCHRYCYGWMTATKAEKDVVYFVCDVCRSDNRKQSLCQVCSVDEGMLKEVAGFGFVHFICAITHPDLNVVDYESLQFEVSISYQTNKRRCQLCRSDNAYSNCAGEGCDRAAHPYCVLTTFKRKELEAEGQDLEDVWKYYISAGENRQFDVSHELPEKRWIEAETASVFKRLQEFAVERPDKRELLNNQYDEMVRNHRPVSTYKRGGFQYILCPSHSKHNMYCVCMIQTENDMVECECCLEWYHYTCGSFKNEEKYICPFCFEWFRLKDKIFEELKRNKPDSYELRVLRPPKYNIPDFILYMIVADRRLQACYDNTGSLGKLIKNIVYYFPLKTSKISLVIKELSERKIEQAAEEYLQQYFSRQEKMLTLKPVLGPGPNGTEIIQANVEHNLSIHEYIIAAQSFINGSNVPFRGLLEALNWKEEVVKLNTFTTEGQIVSLMNTSYPHPELQYIRDKRDQLKLKQQITQAHNSQSTLAELETLIEAASKLGLNDEAASLTQKLESARNILGEIESALQRGVDFDQFKSIEDRMREFSQLRVVPQINLWENYKKEVAFINEMYSLCVKTSNRSSSKQELTLADKIAVLESIDLPKVSKDLKEALKQLKTHSQFTNPKMHHVFLRFNRIVWDHEVATANKENTTPEQLKSLYQEGVKLLLPSYDENFCRISVLYNQWETNHQEYETLFAEPHITKYLDDRAQLDLLYEKLDQATTFYTDVQINAKKELASIAQKRVMASFAERLLVKLGQTNIQLGSLKDLFREADSIKFPKSSQLFKRLNDLLTSNNLLQQQFANLQKKAQDKLDTFKAEEKWKKPRKEQIKSNSDKPTLREAKTLVEQMRQSPVDYASEIETVEEYISISNEIAEKTREFMNGSVLAEFQTRQFWETIKKDSEELRKRILVEAPLSLTTEQVQLYHFEIKSRIIMSFKGFIPSDLDKLGKLLKFADEESIQLELGDWYGRLRTEVEQGTQLQKELDQLKNLEEQLNRQFNRGSTAPFTSLANLRRSMNLQPLKVSSSPLILGIADRAKKFEAKAAALRSQSKPPYEQLKAAYLEGLRIPVELSALQWMAPLIERSCILMKKWSALSGSTVDRLVSEYDKLDVKIDMIENDKNSYVADCRSLEEIHSWIQQQNEGLSEFDVSRAEKVEELWEGLGQTIRTSERYESVRVKFLQYWVNIMKYPQADMKISYLKAKGLLNELYQILRKALSPSTAKDHMVKKLRQPIETVQRMLEKVVDLVARINKFKIIDETVQQSLDVIDITEIYYESKALLQDRRNVVVDVRLRRPYNDLHKFYQEFDRIQSVFADEVPRNPEERKIEPSKEGLKRQASIPLPEDAELRKRIKRQDSYVSATPIVPTPAPLPPQPNRSDSKIVVEDDRKEIRDILSRTIKKNSEFKEVGSDEHAKMIENQIFGDWHQNRKKYLEVSLNFEALFIRLQECPLLSSKVKRKNFEFLTLKGLIDNFHQITDSEEKLQSKARKIKEEEQLQQETLQQLQEKREQELEFKKEIDQIYEIRRQREREQREKDRERRERDRGYGREYKDSRDRPQKKDRRDRDRQREKRREKDRSRSRSRDKKGEKEQLRFSEDQSTPEAAPNQHADQGLGMPSYLEKEYNIRGAYQEFDPAAQVQNKTEPVLFDPDEQENTVNQKEKEVPAGTVIKLKDVELDFLTRNKGKIVLLGAMYTTEDVKRIKEFCDPNLEKIVVRKDKKESDIIEYLAKPSKKKYRNLVGWFEANDPSENEHLKELAQECQDTKRIYGIQNDLVKMHIMSSRQVTKELNNNRLIAPTKISSEAVSKHLGERRMVFIMQFFTEKLYEMRFTSKGFTYQPLTTSFQVAPPPPPPPSPLQHDFYMGLGLGLDHRYSTDSVMTPVTMAPSTPTGMGIMPTLGLAKMRMPSQQQEDYRPKEDIEGWGMDVNTTIPENPRVLRPSNKNFSPITSEDEAEEPVGSKKPPPPSADTKSTFDIRNFLKSLNPDTINKLIEDDGPAGQPVPPPPSPAAPFLTQAEIRNPAPMPQPPPSFVYQPTVRMQHQMPPLMNPSAQRPMPGMQHMGMHMPPPHSMGMPPAYGSVGLPPPMSGNRYPGMRPPLPGNPSQLPQAFYTPQSSYQSSMMGHMQPPPPPGPYDMMRNQPPRPFMLPKKDDQKQ